MGGLRALEVENESLRGNNVFYHQKIRDQRKEANKMGHLLKVMAMELEISDKELQLKNLEIDTL